MGKEVASLCLRVLNDGDDIGQVNMVNIVLIPKFLNLTNMSNF